MLPMYDLESFSEFLSSYHMGIALYMPYGSSVLRGSIFPCRSHFITLRYTYLFDLRKHIFCTFCFCSIEGGIIFVDIPVDFCFK